MGIFIPLSASEALGVTGASSAQPSAIVSSAPAAITPNVVDGTVLSLAKIGDMIVVGGTFSTVRNAGSAQGIARRNVFAFDARTGRVSTTFAPNPNATVYKALPAADGKAVYLAGRFTKMTSRGRVVTVGRLAKVSVATGAQVTAFKPGVFNDAVRDLELTGNRLWVAGKFTRFQGRNQRAMGTVNATTGRYDRYFNGHFSGLHQPGLKSSRTSVLAISVDRLNSELVATGNFTRVNGSPRAQIAKFKIGSVKYALLNWRTRLYESPCSRRFESYVSDVSHAPNGRYFVVSTTGGYGGASGSSAGTSGCDVVARFESSAQGLNVRPTWTAYTGGDTTWTVEVTQDVIYAGGHQRWQNNPTGGNTVGQGAVARTGIAALNPVNGMPYSWNPTRVRGVGIKDMLATDAGLYVGSDTNIFAGQARYKIAFLPLAGGKLLPRQRALALPGQVFRVPLGGSNVARTPFNGFVAGKSAAPPPGRIPWADNVGAFMINGVLYTAFKDGTFMKQTYDGASFGTPARVDASDKLARQTDWHQSDVPKITSMFYSEGRIYFTRTGENYLYSRAFEPESDVVGQQRTSRAAVPGINYASMRGAFVVGTRLFYSNASGTLFSASWSTGGPVGGTSKVVAGVGMGWASQSMFVESR